MVRPKEQVSRLVPGHCFGEVGILEGNTRAASVITSRPALVLSLSA